MIDLRPDLLKSVRELLAQHVLGLEVRAFGSRVKWTAKEHSDLDLVVMTSTPLPAQTLARLEEAFAESDLPMRVDVLDWATLSESFREIIEQGYEVIQTVPTGGSLGMENDFIDSEYGEICASFDFAPLSDLVVEGGVQTGPFGSQLHAEDYVEVGTPIITVEHLGNNRIIHSNLPKVSDEDRERLSRFALQTGDIVFSRVGSVDRRAIVHAEEDGWLFSGRCLRVRPDKTKIDNGYLSYFFGAPTFKEHIRKIAVGATMPSLNTKILGNIRIFFPPLPEQRAIAAILGALDDKIELNRRMNRTLEAMAQALFKEWFVDEAEEEWGGSPVSEVVDINPARPLKKGEMATYLDMANMPTYGHRAIEWVKRPFGSGTRFMNGDTLLARITPCLENGKTAFVDFLNDGEIGWGSTEFIILRPKPPLPPEFGYYLARDENFRNHVIKNMTGTSGRQRAPASCLDQYLIAVPPADLARNFGDSVRIFMAKIRSNDEQSRTLAALRDALLPKLLSGEVRVQDAERFVKEAV